MTTPAEKLVFVGALKGPHGLKGLVKANIKLDDYDLLVRAGPLVTKEGRELKVTKWQTAGQGLLSLTIAGITSIEQAEGLHGLAVYLERERFPEIEDEVYLDELVGEPVLDLDGKSLGVVKAIVDLPGGPALEVDMVDGVKVLPIVEEFVEIGETLQVTELGLEILKV